MAVYKKNPWKKTWRRKHIRKTVGRIRRKITNMNYPIIRSVKSAPYIMSGAGGIPYNLAFKVINLPDYSDFTNLFDRYRIKYVVLRLFYGSSQFPSSTNSPAPFTGFFHYCIDYNDTLNATGPEELLQYQSYKCIPLHKLQGYKIILKPRAEMALYRTGLTYAYGNSPKNTWLDCTSTGIDVPHYGIRAWIDKSGDPQERHLTAITTYHMEFNCVK